VVPLEFFPLNPPAEPFKHPGAMKTPYPDLRHFTTRDYGNRVGVFRILKVLDQYGVKATFAVNAEIAKRYAPLIQTLENAGHEIAAHGVSTAHIHHDGLSVEDEKALIAHTKAVLPGATTWMSPARNESFRTPELVADAGYRVLLDWEADQRPLPFKTRAGDLTALPVMHELSDFKLMIDNRQQADDWATQVLEAAAFHISDYERAGAQCFGFTLTPYVVGQPFRIHALERLISGLSGMDGLDLSTAAALPMLFKEAAA
jgi:peptidoglycan/xylan/chitin deacetylase (PgdA/CDA1 family)